MIVEEDDVLVVLDRGAAIDPFDLIEGGCFPVGVHHTGYGPVSAFNCKFGVEKSRLVDVAQEEVHFAFKLLLGR